MKKAAGVQLLKPGPYPIHASPDLSYPHDTLTQTILPVMEANPTDPTRSSKMLLIQFSCSKQTFRELWLFIICTRFVILTIVSDHPSLTWKW